MDKTLDVPKSLSPRNWQCSERHIAQVIKNVMGSSWKFPVLWNHITRQPYLVWVREKDLYNEVTFKLRNQGVVEVSQIRCGAGGGCSCVKETEKYNAGSEIQEWVIKSPGWGSHMWGDLNGAEVQWVGKSDRRWAAEINMHLIIKGHARVLCLVTRVMGMDRRAFKEGILFCMNRPVWCQHGKGANESTYQWLLVEI